MDRATPDPGGPCDPYRLVVGQHGVSSFLAASAADPAHAYLLVGPPGSGKQDLALGFAADVLCRVHPEGSSARICELVAARNHADVVVIGAEGARLVEKQGEEFLAEVHKSPVEGPLKVVIIQGLQSVSDKARTMLLKTVEEPPASAVLVLVADDLPPALATIASRCVRVDVPPLTDDEVREALARDPALAALGDERLAAAARGSFGDLRRARVLASDESFAARQQAWAAVPAELDGTGATVSRLVAGLLAMVDDAQVPLDEALAAEVAEADAEQDRLGRRRESRSEQDKRHRRIKRAFRMGELRAGLAMVVRQYRQAALDGTVGASEAAGATTAIGQLAFEFAQRSVREPLQLRALFLRLPPLPRS